MNSPVIKITINNNNSFLDVYEVDGKLMFEMGSTDPLNPVGFGTIETEARPFLELLQKLLGVNKG